ncbi:MAG: hypothetical protein DWI29_00925 [Planctomycetota bacterium]|nr:MAG: hypothetical protein DWI29_00925 [Planctomycetota bacterium]
MLSILHARQSPHAGLHLRHDDAFIIPVRDAGCKSQTVANSYVAECQNSRNAVRGNSIGCPVLR